MTCTGKCTSRWRPTAWPSRKKSSRGEVLPTIGSYALALTWPGFAPCHHSDLFLERLYGSAATTGERAESSKCIVVLACHVVCRLRGAVGSIDRTVDEVMEKGTSLLLFLQYIYIYISS